MVLTKAEIESEGIIQCPPGTLPKGARDTTYDATVGEIIFCGAKVNKASFTLKSRGVVWVVSNEDFHVPQDMTGLATLRTTWAHLGVVALNVGVVDPGWQGPIATALVNFGRKSFVIKKNEPFLRVLFLRSNMTTAALIPMNRGQYIDEIKIKSEDFFSDTFLNMSSLVGEVETKVLKLPKWALYIAVLALIFSLISIYAPIAITIWTDHLKNQAAVTKFEERLHTLEDQTKEQGRKTRETLPELNTSDLSKVHQKVKR